ncbi:MAG: hypothetical protein JSS34_04295 [Proteobacteria bacterium]|nr:hypothetical protein [Pseudomonadota bacterium]
MQKAFRKEKYKDFAKSLLTLVGFFACIFPLGIDAMENQEGSEDTREFLSQGVAATGYTFTRIHRTFEDDSASRLPEASRTFQGASFFFERDQGATLLGNLGASINNSLFHANASESLFSQQSFPSAFLHDLGRQRPTPFSFRPPSPDPLCPLNPLKELEKLCLSRQQLSQIQRSGNFTRGNIESYLDIIRSYRHIRDPRPDIIRIRFGGEEDHGDRDGVHQVLSQEEARNLENVMKAARIQRTKESIETIYTLLRGHEIDEDLCIREFYLYLEHLKGGTRYVSFARRNGMNEVDNAFFTLGRSDHPGDHDSILRDDAQIYINLDDGTPVTMKSLLAKTWWLINQKFNINQQGVLKESLVKALGQCIEDDGHRVQCWKIPENYKCFARIYPGY